MKQKSHLGTKVSRIVAISWLILSGFVSILKADPVDVEKARAVALTQLRNVTGDNVGLRSATSLDLVYEPKNEANHPYFYVFNGGRGFVIVSGDDRATPILGYSDEGSFDPDNIPPNMAEFLKGYEKEMDFVIENEIKAESTITKKWNDLKSNNAGLANVKSKKVAFSPLKNMSGKVYTPGDYLVKTEWDQIPPYNALCPYDPNATLFGQRVPAGCVATAMAQIMRYWGTDRGIIPIGEGQKSYVWSKYQVSADFGNTVYDYTKMPAKISHASAEGAETIALLLYHCGVAANMQYGTDESGAYAGGAAGGFVYHLGMHARYVESASGSSDSITNDIIYNTWKNTIKREIDELRPILYLGSGIFISPGGGKNTGHAWVCDGYDEDDFFHMNWGYGGRGDNFWCKLTAIESTLGSYYFNYSFTREAVIHIYPKNIPIEILYVTPEGSGKKDGSSWDNATSDLYTEMKKDRPAPTQIWVKKGTYYGNTSDTVAFILGDGAKVYGGFAGDEQSLDERNLNSNNTSVLDGQNLRKVVGYTTGAFADSAYIDGFIIQHGKDLTGDGGGVCFDLNGTINNCTIKNCTAVNGGGIAIYRRSKIMNCIIENNTAVLQGGGVYYNGDYDLSYCSFINNKAKNGGGIYNKNHISTTVLLRNCLISSNIADESGGGIYNNGGTLILSDNVEIKENKALLYNGGGIFSSGMLTMNTGVVSDNSASSGGGLYITGNSANQIYGGIISDNEAVSGGGIMANGPGIILHGGSILRNNATHAGGGVYSYGSLTIPKTSSVKIQSNSATNSGGGIYTTYGWAMIDGGTIGIETTIPAISKKEAIAHGGNYASNGAGIYVANLSLGILFRNPDNVIIGGNFADNNGGGLYIVEGLTEIRNNVTICGNVANMGGGIYTSAGDDISLYQCTINSNKARISGGGIYNNLSAYNRKLLINGAIISDNTATNGGGGIYNVGSFNMSGGVIASNTANEGGGIYNVGSRYNTFSMSGGELSGNAAVRGPGIYNYRGGNYGLSNQINITDTIYSYNTIDVFNGSHNTFFSISNLTYHTDHTKPITIQLFAPSSGDLAILARLNSSDEASEAIDKGIFKVVNHGWRPVAVATDIKLEAYTPPVVAKNVIHVTPEGAGLQDGSSWENATSDLYGEMKKDRTDSIQIWVKGGIYYGDTTVGQGADLAAFVLGKRNKVYGGFMGNESSLSARVQNNPSILDGRNARRVLCQRLDFADADSSFIDGFRIRNGVDTIAGTANIVLTTGGQTTHNGGTDMSGNGGGVYLRRNGIIRNCIIENCKARSGGGVFNYGGKVIDCSFNNNEAEHAGGIFNRGIAFFAGCTVSNNKTTNRLGYGGGIYNMANLSISNGALINNNKGIVGNGVYTHTNGTTIIDGGEIAENTGGFYGAGIYNDGNVTMNGGSIINNQADNGGGITNYGRLDINGGSISYNTSKSGGGIMSGGSLWINSASVKIQGNYAGVNGTGGGIYIYTGNAFINGVTLGASTDQFPESQEEALALGGNVAQVGGGIHVDYGTLTIGNTDSIIIGGNYATSNGGGIYSRASSTFPSNVIITGNTCDNTGGGLYAAGGTVRLDGCSISNNKSGMDGGGVYQYGAFYIYAGTTIENNESNRDGGGLRLGGNVYMTGGIITGNKALNIGGAIFNGGSLFSLSGGEVFNNQAALGAGIYNSSSQFSLSGSVKMKDIIYIPSSSYTMNIGNLTYHTDSSKPITIQGNAGNRVAYGSLVQSYVDQEILISTPGLSPFVQGNYVYLRNSGTRSAEQSATVNDPIGSEKISVYPTLVTSGGTLTIVSPGGGTASVWNLSGVMVGQHKLVEGKTQVSISCPAGNYVVKVKTGAGEEKVMKIIVK